MARNGRRMLAILLCAIVLTGFVTAQAAPSISDIHANMEVEIDPVSPDGSNTAEILGEDAIYLGQSNKVEYMLLDEEGNYQPTSMSEMIENAEVKATETGKNGKSIIQQIPTVPEIINVLRSDATTEVLENYQLDLSKTMQLTYMMDLKYVSTDTRVIAGDVPEQGIEVIALDNGMYRAKLYGGEILRLDDPDSIHIVHVDAQTEKITILSMEEYESETGTCWVLFPSIGTFMIVQDVR